MSEMSEKINLILQDIYESEAPHIEMEDAIVIASSELRDIINRRLIGEKEKCAHTDMTPHYDHVTCTSCGMVRTDQGPDWGVAKQKNFASLGAAKFYAKHGRLPQ